MSEIIKYRGRLAKKQADARRLEMGMRGDMHAVRELLDPFEPTETIQAEVAAAQAVELAAKHAEYLGLLEEIKALKRALGE